MYCLSVWSHDYSDSGCKLAWPHWGAVREMKEHPDGTSKQPPDKPWGCRWGSLSSLAAGLVCHLNSSPTSPSLHLCFCLNVVVNTMLAVFGDVMLGAQNTFFSHLLTLRKNLLYLFPSFTTPMKWLISLPEFDPFGPITFVKCRRAAWLNHCSPILISYECISLWWALLCRRSWFLYSLYLYYRMAETLRRDIISEKKKICTGLFLNCAMNYTHDVCQLQVQKVTVGHETIGVGPMRHWIHNLDRNSTNASWHWHELQWINAVLGAFADVLSTSYQLANAPHAIPSNIQ